MTRLCGDLLDLEGHAKDGIIPGKTAIGAGIDTLVGEIEGGEHPHRPSKMPARDRSRATGKLLQLLVATRFQQTTKGPQFRRRRGQNRIDLCGESHEMKIMKAEG